VVGAVYSTQRGSCDLTSVDTYLPALKHCVNSHPILSAAIRGHETESPIFVRPALLDLRQHIRLSPAIDAENEEQLLKRVVLNSHDTPFLPLNLHPPWRIDVVALSSQDPKQERCFVAFTYSHSHGDGKSGLTFHRTLLDGLNEAHGHPTENIVHPPRTPLSQPVDDPLRISWNYLLGPLLGTYLPSFITKALGMPTSITPVTSTTWTGAPILYNPNTSRTYIEIIYIDSETLRSALLTCRKHNTKLTAFIHQAILEALHRQFPDNDFVSQTPIDLRQCLPGSRDNDMGVFASSTYNLTKRFTAREQEHDPMLAAAKMTTQFAASATSLQDQPVGLLGYIHNMRSWTLNQLGKKRDTSYELSNIMSFDPSTGGSLVKTWNVEKAIFSQPANVTGSPIAFNAVSIKDGGLVITATWQRGALGVDEEQSFVKDLCADFQASFQRLSCVDELSRVSTFPATT
jgi:hypothetical protein